jgi:hypothetical protein
MQHDDDNKPFIRLTEDEVRRAEETALDARAVAQERFSRYARPDEREQIGLEINPETAEVFFVYAEVDDPYNDEPDFLPKYRCIGREYFAVDPKAGVAVAFRDLPGATLKALQTKRDRANREGWRRIFKISE